MRPRVSASPFTGLPGPPPRKSWLRDARGSYLTRVPLVPVSQVMGANDADDRAEPAVQTLAVALAGTRRRARRARDALIALRLAVTRRATWKWTSLAASRAARCAGYARLLPATFVCAAVVARTWHTRAERSCCERAHAWSEVATGRLHGKRVRVVACDL